MNYVPLYLNLKGTDAREVPFLSSTHVLYDMIPLLRIKGSLYYNLGATAVHCRCIYFERLGLTALYISNTYRLTGLSRDHLARVSRIQYGPDLFPYGVVSSSEILEYVFRCTNTSIKYKALRKNNLLRSVLEKRLKLPDMKISAKHIKHIQVEDLQELGVEEIIAKLGNNTVLLERLIIIGGHESFICGMVLWLLMLPDRARNIWDKSSFIHYNYKSVEDFFSYIKKELTLKLKAIQNTVHMDLTCFFELEVLVNRGIGVVDWESEKRNRTELNVTSFSEKQILHEARQLFTRLKLLGSRPKRYLWDNFWKLRWQWAPTGSYVSQYEEDKEFAHPDYDMRHKFYGLCAMPKRQFDYFKRRSPEIMAKASIKYEWGKQRAIYGVDNTNFIMSSYGMAGAEDVLSKLFPIGVEAESERVKVKVQSVLSNGIPYCFDFEDFNSQHSTINMQAVLRAYLDVFSDKLESEQVESIWWLIRSLESMKVTDPTGTTYKALGTLLSGWRLTTFMNTVLNYVYTQILMADNKFATTHNGDDILGAVTSLEEIRNLECNAVKYNVRFQTTKCYLGSIAEFLRVDHHNGTGSQYLARAISTYVHGPTEMAVPNDPMAVLNAIMSRHEEIKDRGGKEEVLETLTTRQISNVCKIWELDKRLITYYRKIHRVNGGHTLELTDEALKLKFHRTRIKEGARVDEDYTCEEKILPGVVDYCMYMVHKYDLENFFKLLLNTANRAVYSRSVKYRFGVQVIEQEADHLDRLRATQYGMFSKVFSGVKATVAKSFGIPLEAINIEGSYITNLLSWCVNPLEALSLWT